MTTTNPYIGSFFESFLEEEGTLEESTTAAIERVLARFCQRAATIDPAEFDTLLDTFGNNDPPQEGDEVDEPSPPRA